MIINLNKYLPVTSYNSGLKLGNMEVDTAIEDLVLLNEEIVHRVESIS